MARNFISRPDAGFRSLNDAMGNLTVLESPTYTIAGAADLLAIPATSLRRWLEGDRESAPVLRPEPTGSEVVTWGEFIEAGLLREYRTRRVPLQRIRPFVQRLRSELGVPHPLAHARPYVNGRELVAEVQAATDVDRKLYVVITGADGQLVLDAPAARFVDKVDFDADEARRYYPLGKSSPVVLDPVQSFGAPTLAGTVRTANVYELFIAGEGIGAIADGFDLDVTSVEEAIRYEVGRERGQDEAA